MKRLNNFKKKHITKIYLILILLLSFYIRTFNINWDQNFNFHPDERAIIMFTIPLTMPLNLQDFLSPQSPLNPHFFAYGNMPLYLLKIAGEAASYFNPILNDYGGIHLVGRFLSALFDTLSVLIVFLIGSKVFTKKAGIWASILYSLSVFSIQVSHFFAVDTLLTFFLLTSLYILILIFEKQNIKLGLSLGIVYGLSLSTKISALIFIPTIIFTFLLYILSKKVNPTKLFLLFLLTATVTSLVFIITQPYVLIDYKEFINQTKLQTQMSKNPFIFPYTLQYVGKIPYLYELKNIFLWGQGPLIAALSYAGTITFVYYLIKQKLKPKLPASILLFYLLGYFLVFGKFSVGWMRYMLPIYPVLAIFGGFLISEIILKKLPKALMKKPILRKTSIIITLALFLIYPISFLSIYSKHNTRIQASEWINANITSGSKLASEHWDDGLPTFGGEKYQTTQLPLYEIDTDQKWITINQTLKSTDYIIIASNRLYTPLQKLTDCKNLPPEKCYPLTSNYYKNLFSQKLGFKKVAEFSSYPTIPLINLSINDQSADESFTVYDHPKIFIFKRITNEINKN